MVQQLIHVEPKTLATGGWSISDAGVAILGRTGLRACVGLYPVQ